MLNAYYLGMTLFDLILYWKIEFDLRRAGDVE